MPMTLFVYLDLLDNLYSHNIYTLATFAKFFKLYLTVSSCEERIITALFHIYARMNARTSLANNDGARRDGFATKSFDAKTLGIAITPVFGTTYAFLMSHGVFLSASL